MVASNKNAIQNLHKAVIGFAQVFVVMLVLCWFVSYWHFGLDCLGISLLSLFWMWSYCLFHLILVIFWHFLCHLLSLFLSFFFIFSFFVILIFYHLFVSSLGLLLSYCLILSCFSYCHVGCVVLLCHFGHVCDFALLSSFVVFV